MVLRLKGKRKVIEFISKTSIGWSYRIILDEILHPKIIKQLFEVIDEAKLS